MVRLQGNLLERMWRAAELRADDKSWEEVSALIGNPVETCQSWPEKYPVIWCELCAMAEEQEGELTSFMLWVMQRFEEEMERAAGKAGAAADREKLPEPPLPALLVNRWSSKREGPRAAANPSPSSNQRRGAFSRWIGRLLG